VVRLAGRLLPAPGGVGISFHEYEGVVLPPWVRASLRVGGEWLAAGGGRVACLGPGGAPANPERCGALVTEGLPPGYAAGLRLPEPMVCAYATRAHPFESWPPPALSGAGSEDPYSHAGNRVRIAPARSVGQVRVECLAPTNAADLAWVWDPAGGRWERLPPGGSRVVALPARVAAGTHWLEFTAP
jgi:hypothetical protein